MNVLTDRTDREYYTISHRGTCRDSNQDRILCQPELDFFGIADGMGGLVHGERAAQITVKAMELAVREAKREKEEEKDPEALAEKLKDSLEKISTYMFQKGNGRGAIRYGAAFTGCILLEDRAWWIQMGDVRGYHFSKKEQKLTQITKDHALENGVLTRFVGMGELGEAELYTSTFQAGEEILICSDGLYKELQDNKIRQILQKEKEPRQAGRELIRQGNLAGGRDNLSLVLLKRKG